MCFRHADGDGATDALAAAVNAVPTLHVTPSLVDGRRFIRVSVGQTQTTAADVDRLWEAVTAAA